MRRNRNSRPALSRPAAAAAAGWAAASLLLLAASAEAGQPRPSRLAPLAEAAAQCDANAARALLDAGAAPDQTRRGEATALKVAADRNCLAVADLLIAAGADIDFISRRDRRASPRRFYEWGSALYFAVRGGHEIMVARLLAAGADPDQESATIYDRNRYHQGGGYAMLGEAAMRGHCRIMRILIGAGADINRAGEGHGAPLTLSLGPNFDFECMAIAIEAGADVNHATPKSRRFHPEDQGMTALMLAALWLRADEALLLLALGADPAAETALGEDIAQIAAFSPHHTDETDEAAQIIIAALRDPEFLRDAARLRLGARLTEARASGAPEEVAALERGLAAL